MEAFSAGVVRFRWQIIAVFVAVTAAFASQVRHVQVDPEVKNMLPADMPARLDLDAIEKLFGGTDMVMAVLVAEDVLASSTLERTKKLSRKMARIRGVDRVLSLTTLKEIRAGDGEMVVEPAVVRIPASDADREALRARLRDNDLVYGNVVAADFKATAIIGMLSTGVDDVSTLAALEEAIEAVPGPEAVHVAGMPFVRASVASNIRGDMATFLPAGLLVMLVFLFWAFRQLRGVLLPFIVVVMSIVFSMGLIAVIGWKIQIVTILLPVILIAVANDYGIHLLARYQEENGDRQARGAHELARSIVVALAKPVLITGVTTIAGLLCLLSHVVVPAAQLGVLASAGVTYALAGSLLFIPAVLAVLPTPKAVAHAASTEDDLPWLERLLRRNAELVSRHPRAILVIAAVGVGVVATGIVRVDVDTNPVNYYEDDAPVARSASLVNEHFGGSTSLSVVAKGDIKHPRVLGAVQDLQEHLDSMATVGSTSSIVDVVTRMNRAMHDDEPAHDKLPESREAVAQYFLLYGMSGDPEDFDRLVDFPFEHALLTARINSLSTNDMTRVTEAVDAYVAAHPEAPFSMAGGFAAVFSELVGAVVRGQILSLVLSLFAVGVLVMILFRSVVAGLLALIPLVLSMALLFGLMGYLGIELNVPMAMLSSIMIGVGVDYTIHFLWRYRQQRGAGSEPTVALRQSLTTTGRGIVFNALSVIIGFAALLLSAFVPVKMFGFLIVVCIGACLIGALMLLPAIALVARPKFLEPEGGL